MFWIDEVFHNGSKKTLCVTVFQLDPVSLLQTIYVVAIDIDIFA